MRIFRKRSLRKNMALVLMSSFFLNFPISLLDARAAQQQSQTMVKLEYAADSSLKTILGQMVAEGYASQDVRSCNDALKKGQTSVDVNVLVRALPDIMLQVYKAKDVVVRNVKNEAHDVDANAKNVLSALRALKQIKDNLSAVKSTGSQDLQLVLQALQDMLGDMPAGNFDAAEYLRFISSTNDLGIRQILVQMVGCIDTLTSKLDECCFSIDSKLDLIDDGVLNCCATLNSKLDKVDEDVLECCTTVNSKLDKIDEDVLECCFTLGSKIDGINSADFAPCCFTLGSKLDKVDEDVLECCFTLGSKIDSIPTNDFSTCCSTLEVLIEGVDSDLFTCCSSIESIVTQCCDTVNSKLDLLLTRTEAASGACEPTPIFAPTTISTSGSYCLANNIGSVNAETILITAVSNVVLDLNGHDVSNPTGGAGITVTGGGTNIVIANGTVTGFTFTGTGLLLTQPSSHVLVKNVSVFGWQTAVAANAAFTSLQDCDFASAVNFDGSSDCDIQRCRVSASNGESVTATGASRLTIKDCQVTAGKSGTNCVHLISANQVYVIDSSFAHNQGSGLFVDTNCTGVQVANCSAISTSGGNSGSGFAVDTATSTLIKNCYAAGFNVGYLAGISTELNIEDSVAKGCGVGFLMTGEAVLRGNTADFNETGFVGNASQTYYSNIACNNSVNYVGVLSAPVTSPANARGVMNVDCSNAQSDQVADTLSTVDQLATNMFTCCSSLEALSTNCCFSINSNIDGIEECCFTVNSKTDIILMDVVKTQTTVGNVGDLSLDSCAFTTTASIDAASISVISWLKTIYRDIRGFVTALPSQC